MVTGLPLGRGPTVRGVVSSVECIGAIAVTRDSRVAHSRRPHLGLFLEVDIDYHTAVVDTG